MSAMDYSWGLHDKMLPPIYRGPLKSYHNPRDPIAGVTLHSKRFRARQQAADHLPRLNTVPSNQGRNKSVFPVSPVRPSSLPEAFTGSQLALATAADLTDIVEPRRRNQRRGSPKKNTLSTGMSWQEREAEARQNARRRNKTTPAVLGGNYHEGNETMGMVSTGKVLKLTSRDLLRSIPDDKKEDKGRRQHRRAFTVGDSNSPSGKLLQRRLNLMSDKKYNDNGAVTGKPPVSPRTKEKKSATLHVPTLSDVFGLPAIENAQAPKVPKHRKRLKMVSPVLSLISEERRSHSDLAKL